MFQNKSYIQIRELLNSGQVSCVQLVEYCLANIAERNGELNALLSVYDKEALERATQVDKKLRKGEAGLLAGLVVSIKDVLCYQDHPLSCGSKILEGFDSQFSATCVERLLAEDAIIIGRNNCDEFAMGSSCENSAYGAVKNGDNTSRVPGGSSGGSAVAVQSGMSLVSLGTDTGGSVRQPASFCGVIGFKPTYSRISRYGLAAYASSFDTVGIFAKDLEDIALVLEVVAGEDQFDSTVSTRPIGNYLDKLAHPSGKKQVAVLEDAISSEAIQPEVKSTTKSVIEQLSRQGHNVEFVSFPMLEYALATYYILTTAEASSNLSRYDGVKFGHRTSDPADLMEMYKKTRTEGFGLEALRRIMLGTFVLSASYHDAFYTKAQKVRRLIKDQMEVILSRFDYIILPTAPTTAFELNSKNQDPLEMYLADLFTVPASIGGFPAISIPIGADVDGLSIGLQIIGNSFEEEDLLCFSNAILNEVISV